MSVHSQIHRPSVAYDVRPLTFCLIDRIDRFASRPAGLPCPGTWIPFQDREPGITHLIRWVLLCHSPGVQEVQRVKRVNHAVERKKRLRLRVVAIDPAKYPLFRDDPSHPFSGMEPERRLEEIVSYCGTLWARACEEAARKSAKQGRPSEAA